MQIKQKLACANYLNFQSNLVSHHFQLFTCVAFYLKNIYEYEFLLKKTPLAYRSISFFFCTIFFTERTSIN